VCFAGCLFGCARQARRKGCLERSRKIRNRQWAHATSPLRLPPTLPLEAFAGSVRDSARPCWSSIKGMLFHVGFCLPAVCPSHLSWLSSHVLAACPTLMPALFMFSYRCRFDYPRAMRYVRPSLCPRALLRVRPLSISRAERLPTADLATYLWLFYPIPARRPLQAKQRSPSGESISSPSALAAIRPAPTPLLPRTM
jgi:hypothetical protein